MGMKLFYDTPSKTRMLKIHSPGFVTCERFQFFFYANRQKLTLFLLSQLIHTRIEQATGLFVVVFYIRLAHEFMVLHGTFWHFTYVVQPLAHNCFIFDISLNRLSSLFVLLFSIFTFASRPLKVCTSPSLNNDGSPVSESECDSSAEECSSTHRSFRLSFGKHTLLLTMMMIERCQIVSAYSLCSASSVPSLALCKFPRIICVRSRAQLFFIFAFIPYTLHPLPIHQFS